MINKLHLQKTADGSYTLAHPDYPETYHSQHGAVNESEIVFLQNSGVNNRLQQQQDTAVLEIGFGTGLNFMLTARTAKQYRCNLSYTAYDYRLPPVELIKDLLMLNVGECESEIEQLVAQINHGIEHVQQINRYTSLALYNHDARTHSIPGHHFDAIYLDAFSIKQNPDLWKSEFLHKLASSLKDGGTIASYSVNRAFKDALTDAGLSYRKLPGPAGKREVILATLA